MSSSKEKSLIHRLKAGDGFAFEELYLEYYSKVYHFSLRMLKNNIVEAEGVAQDVFASVWENRMSLNEEFSFSGYIFKQAKNRILNLWRKELNKKQYNHEILNTASLVSKETSQQIASDDLSEKIYKILEKLPERRRQIFLLSRDQGLSYKEIATKLQISENTVDTQIRHALKFLRAKYTELLITVIFFLLNVNW